MKELNDIIREMDGLKMSEEQKYYVIAKAWYGTLRDTAAEIEKQIGSAELDSVIGCGFARKS